MDERGLDADDHAFAAISRRFLPALDHMSASRRYCDSPALNLAAILPLALIPPSATAADEAVKVFEKANRSVVIVRGFDAKGGQATQGSGVVTAVNEVTTNCHLLENISRVEILRVDGNAVAAEITGGNRGRDICLLSVQGLNETTVIRAAGDLKVGETVFAIGSPRGLEFTISGGIVSQLRVLGGTSPLIQTDAAISPGYSGGGLFDSAARLVGITTFYYKDGQNLNFALPSEWIAEARRNGLPFSKSTPDINSGASLVFWDKALELSEAKDWNGLLAHSQRWTQTEPENFAAHFFLGLTYGELDRFDEAIAAYREALRSSPEYALAWYNLGVIYGKLYRYDEAIAAYREALRINPEFAEAWNNLGTTYDGLDRYDEARAAYLEALRIDPEFAEAWYNLGITYYELGRHDETIAAFREAVRTNPEGADAWYNLGFIYSELDRYDEAIVPFREALRINPEDAVAWNNLGDAYDKLGRYDEAIATFREALRVNPEYAVAWYNLGVIYGKLYRYDEAIAAYRETLRINPEDAEAWHLLSLVYRQVGRNAEADAAEQNSMRINIPRGE